MDRGVKVVAGTAIGCAALLGLGIAVAWSLAIRRTARAASWIAGDVDVELLLTREGGDAEQDGARMRLRLEDLGIESEVETSEGRIRLVAHDVVSPEVVAEVVAPARHLAFYLVDETDGSFAPERFGAIPGGMRPVSDGRGITLGADSAGPVLELIARVQLRPDRMAAVECRPSRQTETLKCLPRVLELPPFLTASSLVAADVMIDSASGAAVVMLSFDEEGARRLESVTASSVGRRLAIVVDDEVLTSPVIINGIPGGRAQITLGSGHTFEDTAAEAAILESGLLPSHTLAGTWAVEYMELGSPGG